MAKVSFGSGGGGGAATGVPISGAVANTVLFSNASSNLGSVAGFNFLQTMNQSSGTSSVFEVSRSITQSSTAAYNGICVNITETSTGSGIKNLLSLQIGGANRARIDNTGSTFLSNTATSGFRVFNSADETTNTEFAGVRWDTNVAKFGADRTGSGTERESWFGSMFGGLGRTYIRCIPSGVVHMYLDVPGSSTAGQTGFWLSNNAAYNASSGSQSFMYMNYSVSQSGTAGYDGLLLNVGETSTGSGTKNLLRLTVGSSHRFSVRNDGTVWIGPGSTVSTFTPSATTPKLLCQAQVVTGGQIGFQWAGSFAGEMTPASGIATYMTIRPNITTSSTGGYTVLQVTGSDGGAGTGAKNILSIGANAEFQISNLGVVQYTPSAVQTLAAANPIVVDRSYLRVQGSGGAVTITATPTIAAGIDGQVIRIVGQSNTNTITVQDRGTLASSNLQLGASTRILGQGDVLVLMYTGTIWSEVSYINNL